LWGVLNTDGTIWHRTGDAGSLDDNGRLWLRGRHAAKVGKWYPFEVECSARLWPGVTAAALIPGTSSGVLALVGQETKGGAWQARAEEFGEIEVRIVGEIPMDRRHNSKVDYGRLSAQASFH